MNRLFDHPLFVPAVVLLVCGIIAVGIVLGGAATTVPQSQTKNDDAYLLPETIDPILTSTVHVDKKDYISITLAKGWSVAKASDLRPPEGVTSDYGFTREGSTCVLAYAALDRDLYAQTFFGTRVFNKENDQFDSNWMALKVTLPSDFKFAWEGPQHMEHEIRVISAYSVKTRTDDKAFILYTKDGSSVPSECDVEVNRMIETAARMPFVVEALDRGAEGAVAVVRFNDVLFIDQDNLLHKIGAIATSSAQINPRLFVYKNTLYYLPDDGIHRLTLSPWSDVRLQNMTLPKGQIIVAIFVRDGVAYYLTDTEDCAQYMGSCDSALYQYPLDESSPPILLAEHVHSRTILGYSPEDASLYLLYSDGDAGMYWGSIERYDFNRHKLIPVGEYGGCASEEFCGPITQKTDEELAMEAILHRFSRSAVAYMAVAQGMIVGTTTDRSVGRTEPVQFFH